MRKKYIFGKKLYISVLTSILVLLTTVATTFAWVGVFANSTFESINVNLFSSSLEEYGIEISATGEEGTFSDSIDFDLLKPQILKNFGYSEYQLTSQTRINELYNSLNFDQCTNLPIIKEGKMVQLDTFKDIGNNPTTKLMKFDIFISPTHNYDKESSSDFKLDLYLDKGLLTGHVKSKVLENDFTYPDTFINPLNSMNMPSNIRPLIAGETIKYTRVNSKDVVRVAFEKYEVVDKYDTLAASNAKHTSALIFQDSLDYPYYDTELNTYSFGGILPDDYNLAVGYFNSTDWRYSYEMYKSISIPESILNTRGVGAPFADKTLSSTTNHLIDSQNILEQLSINQMMKVTIYMWFEGCDADCFPAVNYSKVNMNIKFIMSNTDEF